jgi:hypothetical protein
MASRRRRAKTAILRKEIDHVSDSNAEGPTGTMLVIFTAGYPEIGDIRDIGTKRCAGRVLSLMSLMSLLI